MREQKRTVALSVCRFAVWTVFVRPDTVQFSWSSVPTPWYERQQPQKSVPAVFVWAHGTELVSKNSNKRRNLLPERNCRSSGAPLTGSYRSN